MSCYLKLLSPNWYEQTRLLGQDDVIKWKHFPRYWPFVRGIHRSPINSPHKGKWLGALMFSLIYAWANGWFNTRDASDLNRHRTYYDVTVMVYWWCHDKESLFASLVFHVRIHCSPEDSLHKGPVLRGFGVSFCFSPNKLLNKQSNWGD